MSRFETANLFLRYDDLKRARKLGLVLALCLGCGDSGSSPDPTTETTGTSTDSDSDSGTSTGTATDTGPGPSTGTATDPGTSAGTDTDPGTSTSTGTSTGPGSTLVTYVTGEMGPEPVIFRVEFDPSVAGSGVVTTAVSPMMGFGLDGIDFNPDVDDLVFCTSPSGAKLTQHNVATGETVADLIPDTNAITSPPAGGGSFPSSILSTATHVYYVENQFGFGSTTDHRIIRTGLPPAGEEVVFAGSASGAMGLVNYEGLEIIGDRLYFFARDPGDATKRALISIALSAGLWDAAPPTVEIPGLSQGADSGEGPGLSDGSDELDYDSVSGYLFGTNIISGEIIALDPAGGPVTPAGTTAPFFIDPAQVAGGMADGLGLLGMEVDGIRSDGMGHLIFSGRGGVVGSIDVAGAMDGVDDADVIGLVVEPGTTFDDLTPPRAEP